MKKRLAVQMLTAEQYERLFGRLREASAAPGPDPVLRWYRSKGWKSFSGLEWMLEVAKAMGLDLSKFKDYTGRVFDDDDLYMYLRLNTDDFGHDDGRFSKAAAAVLKKAVGESQFAYAGQGIAKVAFVDNAGHALKIGRCLDGEAVTREIDINLRTQDLECFPKLLAYAPDKTSYMCECARESRPEDFQRLFALPGAQNVADLLHEPGAAERFAADFEKTGERKFKVLADLAKYASENMLEDLHEGNWGLTTRGGQEVLIVIDYDI